MGADAGDAVFCPNAHVGADRLLHVADGAGTGTESRNYPRSASWLRARARGEAMRPVKKPETYDAIIIGSGMTGGWAAKELTEKGLKVLVLEAGRPIVPEQDYVEHVPIAETKFRGMTDRQQAFKDQPI